MSPKAGPGGRVVEAAAGVSRLGLWRMKKPGPGGRFRGGRLWAWAYRDFDFVGRVGHARPGGSS